MLKLFTLWNNTVKPFYGSYKDEQNAVSIYEGFFLVPLSIPKCTQSALKNSHIWKVGPPFMRFCIQPILLFFICIWLEKKKTLCISRPAQFKSTLFKSQVCSSLRRRQPREALGGNGKGWHINNSLQFKLVSVRRNLWIKWHEGTEY